MGWSATVEACNVMDAVHEYCKDSSEMGNTWTYKDNKYFCEVGKEHRDGHISMVIHKEVDNGRYKPSGSIYIEANGYIRRMPKYLKEAIKPYLPDPDSILRSMRP